MRKKAANKSIYTSFIMVSRFRPHFDGHSILCLPWKIYTEETINIHDDINNWFMVSFNNTSVKLALVAVCCFSFFGYSRHDFKELIKRKIL